MKNAHSFSNWGDRELVRLISQGNEAAFEEIYNRYWDRLFTVAANKLHELTEAEEIVQDVFLDLWKRRKTLEIASPAGYLAVAVKYKVIDHLAKKANHQKYESHALRTHNIADHSTEHQIDGKMMREKISLQVAALPEKCRLVFVMSRDQGLSQRQIALQLGIAEKTVESHLGKALRTLRMSLGQFLGLFIFLSLLSTRFIFIAS